MSEQIRWYQDRTAMIWAGIWAILAIVFYEGLTKLIEKSQAYLETHSNVKEIVDWLFLLIPWAVLSVIMFLFLRWRKRAKVLATLLDETKLAVEQANQNCADAQSMLQLMSKWDGIEPTTGLDKYIKKLEGSGHHPRELLDKIERKLDFMGHGASKWTANRVKLTKMLENIGYNNPEGKVRFLVIDPTKTELEIDKTRAQAIAGSLRTLRELQRAHPNLEVRIYNHIPQLRMTFYDDDLVVVGHYQGKERQDSSNTPLLVFLRKCDWSFYKAFLSHFEEEWKRATPLCDTNMEEIAKLI